MFQLILYLAVVQPLYSAKILTVSVFPSYSHQAVYQGVWKELANRGHEVVSITPSPIDDPSISNLREIDISFTKDIWYTERMIGTRLEKLIMDDFHLLGKISDKVLNLVEIQDLMKNSSFDLVIAEWINPVEFAFSSVFKCPLIGISSINLLDSLSSAIGNPVHPIVNPVFVLPFKSAKTFWERLKSLEISLFLKFTFHFQVLPSSNELIRKNMGAGLPDIQEIIKNVSVVFVNSNFLFSKPKPHTSNIIEFSGLHMNREKPLPRDMQSFLDSATQGAIYFSLGSFIKGDMLSKKLKNIILETFLDLPYKVLWKFDDQNITIPSKRIRIYKWLPQQDILAHKNVKVFITQGGLQSTEEAIRKRVPMVGLPFFCDQPSNMEALTELGIAKNIDKSKVTKEIFKKAIIEVMENQKYHEKIDLLANVLEDEPVKSLDKVIWWIEYVIRHKGAPHLRSPFLEIPWYQYFMLDILSFLFCCLLAIFLILTRVLKYILRYFKYRKQKNE